MIIHSDEAKKCHEFCQGYIKQNCILFGNFPAKNPKRRNKHIFYMKRGMYNIDFMIPCAKILIYRIEGSIKHFDFQLAGVETGATPLLTSIPLVLASYNIKVNAFSIRKDKKTYGLLNRIEGIPNRKPVLLIDDIYNSGSSVRKARQHLAEEGINNIMEKTVSILCKKPAPHNIYAYTWDKFTN
jgi:orotate phosphoribosyltransferase